MYTSQVCFFGARRLLRVKGPRDSSENRSSPTSASDAAHAAAAGRADLSENRLARRSPTTSRHNGGRWSKQAIPFI